MTLCIQVLYVINARIRIVQNFVDRPSASTSSANNRGVFVLLYKAFMRTTNKAIWPYGFINKGTRRDILYYCLTQEMSSKENSPAIGSFLSVVMLSMIIKCQLQCKSKISRI